MKEDDYTPMTAEALDKRQEFFEVAVRNGSGSGSLIAASTVCQLRIAQKKIERLTHQIELGKYIEKLNEEHDSFMQEMKSGFPGTYLNPHD